MVENNKYIQARKSQLLFYTDVPLYRKVNHTKFVLYKSSGFTLGDMRLENGRHPSVLYIKQSDMVKALNEAQKALNNILETHVKSGDPEKVKETLVTLVTESFTVPKSGSLENISDTVNILVGNYAKESDMIKLLLGVHLTDYTLALHSINVMTYALSFALYNNYSQSASLTLGLCSLMHDVGKSKIDPEILKSQRKLTEAEFASLRNHTTFGYDLLSQCQFNKEEIPLSALEHHEKLDGSGYPLNKTMVAPASQLIGIIDSYEALTNDGRQYRKPISGFQALDEVILKDVKTGKISPKVCSQFIRSLGASNS